MATREEDQMRNTIGDVVACMQSHPVMAGMFASGSNACEILSGRAASDGHGARTQAVTGKRRGILYADIAEMPRSCDQSENDQQQRLHEGINFLMRNLAENGGRPIDIDGQAILAQFEDTDQALHCAINVQLAARQWNADTSQERRILFRIGITGCEASADMNQCREISKCLASHFENLTSVAGICVFGSIRADLLDHPSVNVVGAGKHQVSDLYQPVETFWIEIDSERFISGSLTGAVKITV